MKVFAKVPGVIYNFENQSLVTFEDNLKFMGDLPSPAYFDFETTTKRLWKIRWKIQKCTQYVIV